MGGAERAREGVDRLSKATVTITQPGYYRIGKDVGQLTCRSNKFLLIYGQGMVTFFSGSVYAPPADSPRDPQSQWIYVDEQRLQAGPLQFEVSYRGKVDLSQLLPKDEEREVEVASAIAGVSDGTAGEVSQVGRG